MDKMKKLTVVVVLGTSGEIYRVRAAEGVRVFKEEIQKVEENNKVLLLAKYYKDPLSWNLQKLQSETSPYAHNLWVDEISKRYLYSRHTFDTINEAVGVRHVIEQNYLENIRKNVNFIVEVIVVTSECHIERAKLFFDLVFADVQWVKISTSPSQTTANEIQDNRLKIEKKLIVKQCAEIEEKGGMPSFINYCHQYYGDKYHFMFVEYNEQNTNRSKYFISFDPPAVK